ncbi:Nicotinamide/nicotinic acid mononucleotide adenylyltransferase [Linum perenne]
MEAVSGEEANAVLIPGGNGGGVDGEGESKAVSVELVKSLNNNGNVDRKSSTRPPIDDCCPICFSEFVVACKANCGHWYCGSCILQFWNYSAASRPCKCPMCSSSITNLTPEASLLNLQGHEVTEVLKNVQRYNRLYIGGARGLVQKVRESPLLIKRVVMRIMDPDGPDYIHEARLLAMIMTLIYVLCPFDFLPISRAGLSRVFDYGSIAVVLVLRLVGLYLRRRLNQRLNYPSKLTTENCNTWLTTEPAAKELPAAESTLNRGRDTKYGVVILTGNYFEIDQGVFTIDFTVSTQSSAMDYPLPMDKISAPNKNEEGKVSVVLVATGSFNPPTFMHLRMFELAKDALQSEGYRVIAGYMSPVTDAYKKPGLISAEHRLRMCELACESSDFIMVDPWEANQSTYQRSLTVLRRIESVFINDVHISKESLKVMLVCGADLLQSFTIPGLWIPDQVRTICRDYGIACIRREGHDVQQIIASDEILNESKDNIKPVDEPILNTISSSRLRDCRSRGLSIKYLTADSVISYIGERHLYLETR